MADYTDSKPQNRATFPVTAIATHEFQRLEPLITPKQIRERVLFGIQLMSDVADPITRKKIQMSDDHLKDFILGAVAKLEIDSGMDIAQVQHRENQAFDRNTFQQWGYIRTNVSPITSLDSITIKPADNLGLYQLPLEWISSAGFHIGKINIVPVAPIGSVQSYSSSGQGTGAAFLAILGQFSFIPSFWEIIYTTGWSDSAVPRIVNELLGCYAGQEILSLLAATNTTSSSSLSHDGLSQSRSSPGPQRYDVRIKNMEETRVRLLKKLKSLYGRSFILGTL
jgi:hypothetical protein